ncbi:MAG: putative non-ribosomal peptide synthetase [Blastococcus sp.]|nr:putative non-ribosomal peptide synthetase [Blastococcus sp.]
MTTSERHETKTPIHVAPLPDRVATTAVYSGSQIPPPRTLWDILERTAAQFPGATAIDDGESPLNYRVLLDEVRRLDERLTSMGVGAGDRVGVRLPSGTTELYVSILAVLAIGAAYVPVDLDDPDDRAHLVWSEAGVCAVVGGSGVTPGPVPPLGLGARRPEPQDDAWIIFTSGSTGTPKGVAVTHRSAAAFVDAEAQLFLQKDPLRPGDRVLAGLSVAFDASCEEMWLAWGHGACLVPAPRSLMKTGPDLAPWLVQRRISVISTVPTMASLWPVDALTRIRLLILGGEACPAGLADRLAARCPEVWNTYGPTETTVVACAARLFSGQPVRIGLPLAGWQLAVVDPGTGEPVRWGETGELVIGGVGVARYLDADKDAAKFAPVEALGSERAYRSGDLVQADPEGLLYLGRADTQVKIRGYRIELTEIESVLTQLPGIAQAVVTTYEQQPGLVELVGYYSVLDEDRPPDHHGIYEQLRSLLPAHMVPAYLEKLADIPLSRSGKADRKKLPAPTGHRRSAAGRPHVEPSTSAEKALADALAEVLGVDRVSVDDHFFDDLAANSLLIAHFCARARQGPECASVSTKDVYLHPTVRRLAGVLTQTPAVPAEPGTSIAPEVAPRAATWRYVLCAALQLGFYLAAVYVAAVVANTGFTWISEGVSAPGIYLRSVAFGAAILVGLAGLPILAKWALVGRWTSQEIPAWSLRYFRFWLVKTMLRTSPLTLFAGSPIYVLYLRALGARIGRRVVILSRTVPVCTDMLTIGDDTVIWKNSSFTGYRASAGSIQTGPVTIGKAVFVGDHTVLDIGTSLGDGAQLGHTSSLHQFQKVPGGQRWHGSPAQPTDVDYRRVGPATCGPVRRICHGILQVVAQVVVTVPLAVGVIAFLATRLSTLPGLASPGTETLSTGAFYEDGLVVSLVLFFGAILAGSMVVTTVPRLLHRFITPSRTYVLYGGHHLLHRVIGRLTGIGFFLELTGDSSYVVHYLRALGYRFPQLAQTGSNVGGAVTHETPFLAVLGRGTQISDGFSFLNADYSNTSFSVAPATVGAHSFFGNLVAYPSGARVGDNCLVGTKTMVPLDGPVRTGVGLLGSPSFEIPRSVQRDLRGDLLQTGDEFGRRLAAKNKYNLRTMGVFLTVRWVHFFVLTLFAQAAWDLRGGEGAEAIAGMAIGTFLFSVVYFAAIERAMVTLRPLRPELRSIYDSYFFWHERYWKMQNPRYGSMLNGTPFKSVVWRMRGVRVGRRLFDCGLQLSEPPLLTIGDDCTFNEGSIVQCHSMEDSIFKADHTEVGAGCTIGVGAFVHYGVTMGEDSYLQPDAFLMKGEQVPPHSRWTGNPARHA